MNLATKVDLNRDFRTDCDLFGKANLIFDWQVVKTIFREKRCRELSLANLPDNRNYTPTVRKLRS